MKYPFAEKLGYIKVNREVHKLVCSSFIHRFGEPYEKALNRLKELSSMRFVDLQKLIRSKGHVPFSGFNKFGLMLQVIEIEFGKDIMDILQHYVWLEKP